MTMTVNRTGGSRGAVSVAYATSNGTAIAGTDFTAAAGTLQWASGDATSKSFSVAISNASPYTGSKAFTVALSGETGGATLSSPSSATVTITGSRSTSTSTFWVYYDGVFNWGGDYSFAAAANYKDTTGIPEEGAYDIAVTLTSAWGGFLPYAGGTVPLWNFNDNAYNYLVVDLKPTVANQQWQIYFVKVGDISLPSGCAMNVLNFGPAPVVGKWATYKIPLSSLCVAQTAIYKVAIQDQTGLARNTWYVDNLGFSVN